MELDSISDRLIKEEKVNKWNSEYSWAFPNLKDHKVFIFCKLCFYNKFSNKFTKGYGIFKKDNLKKHYVIYNHKRLKKWKIPKILLF